MDLLLTFAAGIGIGIAVAIAWTSERRRGTSAAEVRPETSTPVAHPDAAAVHARLRKILQGLEPQMDALSQPTDALQLHDFRRGVDLLRSESLTASEVCDYVTGANWVACCMAAQALAERDDGGQVVDAVADHVQHLGPWPIDFVLRYLDVAFDGPLLGRVIVRAQQWWWESAPVIQALNSVARSRRESNRTPSFGKYLPQIKNAKAVSSLLGRLDARLFEEMRREFAQWRATRIDEGFLGSVGRFIDTEAAQGWLPDSPRLSRYLEQMLQTRTDGAVRSILLVGEPGVGCDVLQTRFARELSAEGWRHFETSAAGLIAGKKYIGEIEGQVTRLLQNANVRKHVVLHIKRFHELESAGRYSGKPEAVLDQILPAIEKGEILAVGQTTGDAWQRMVRRLPALRHAMEVIRVQPADYDETRMLAEEFLVVAGGCEDERQAKTLANETVQLARQYVTAPAPPASALRLLEMALQGREASETPDAPLGRDDVLISLSRLTGLPLDVLDEGQALNIQDLVGEFEKRVIGQPEAVQCLVERIAMLKAGLTDSGRPIGVYLFAGPTGTGKTEIAKALAEIIFGDRERMIRLDMSEFQRPDSVDKLLGDTTASHSPDRSLIGRIREQPFSVVLLDEFEKANQRIWDLFLQVFDDGRLADNAGNVADFRHTIIILTSNLGATIRKHAAPGFTSRDGSFSPGDVMHAVTKSFRKEFINRLDRVVVFNPLSREVMRRILNKELRLALERRGFRNREWAVEWEDTAVSFLLDKGFTPDMGARPLRRAIEQHFLAPLSITIVENQFPQGDQFLFVRSDGEELQVIFVDPDEEMAGEEESVTPSTDLSLNRIVLAPGNSDAERQFLLSRCAELDETVGTEDWEEQKAGTLARINEPDFWEDDSRHAVLGRAEFLDRIESAAAAVRRLRGRLESSRGSRQLNAQLAHKLYLLETALADLEADRPGHALLRVDAGTGDSAQASRRAFESTCRMYLNWAKRRGMRTKVLPDGADSAKSSFTLAVGGFGAYSLLEKEQGLHVYEFPDQRRHKNIRAHVTVRVLPQPDRPVEDFARFVALADQAFAGEPLTQPAVVRRYQCLESPLVRDKVRNWRSGRLDQVLDGQFDLMA